MIKIHHIGYSVKNIDKKIIAFECLEYIVLSDIVEDQNLIYAKWGALPLMAMTILSQVF